MVQPPKLDADALTDKRVLVLDNDPEILASMEALLSGWGVTTELAATLEEAVLSAEAATPDLVLADYHLEAAQTGLELRQLLNDSGMQHVPMVMLTADRSSETRQAFRDAGVLVLNKPVKPGKLRALMTHLLAD